MTWKLSSVIVQLIQFLLILSSAFSQPHDIVKVFAMLSGLAIFNSHFSLRHCVCLPVPELLQLKQVDRVIIINLISLMMKYPTYCGPLYCMISLLAWLAYLSECVVRKSTPTLYWPNYSPTRARARGFK